MGRACKTRPWRRGLAAFFVASLPACSALLDARVEQCVTDSDCEGRGGALAGRVCVDRVCRPRSAADAGPTSEAGAPVDPAFACFGSVTWPDEQPGLTVTYRQRFVRLVGGVGTAGVEVLACGALDPPCAQPLDRQKTDAEGYVAVRVPRAFRGYLQLASGGTAFPQMLPHLLAVTPPPVEDADLSRQIPPEQSWSLVTQGELEGLLSAVGSKIDPELGHVIATGYDCQSTLLAGLTARATPTATSTLPFYFQGSTTPSISATQTDGTGLFGFVNVPPGILDVTTEVKATGRKHAHYGLLIKKGWVTLLDAHPSPF